ncbi:MAG TPA: YCF48-related protein [Blastocatellia bacterium]|nr:YCF48-related protein [Blastocatellia bacterium]
MRMNPRRAACIALCLFSLTRWGCTEPGKNSNQAAPAQPAAGPQKLAKWVAQFRSPASAGFAGTNLATFSYASISVVSPSVVFVAGDMPDSKNSDGRAGVIVNTTDGGRTWKETVVRQPGLEIPTVNAIHFVDQNTGWAVGADSKGNGVVLKTADGGAAWSAQRLAFKQSPTCVFFVDAATGWMGAGTPLPQDEDSNGGPSDLLATTDGGATWRSARRLPVSISDIFFLDKANGWAAGYRGSIYQTTDGGVSWIQQRSELEAEGAAKAVGETGQGFSITSIQFLDRQNGWAGASAEEANAGRALGTNNGGTTWTRRWIVADSGVNDIFFLSPTVGWAATNLGKFIYHTPDGARSWFSEPIIFDQELPIYKIAGADLSHVWAVGGGAIYTRVVE